MSDFGKFSGIVMIFAFVGLFPYLAIGNIIALWLGIDSFFASIVIAFIFVALIGIPITKITNDANITLIVIDVIGILFTLFFTDFVFAYLQWGA